MRMCDWDLLYICYEVSKPMILSSTFFAIFLTSLQTKDLCNRQTLSGSQSVMHLSAWSLAESQALLVSHVVETTLHLPLDSLRFEQACTRTRNYRWSDANFEEPIFHPAFRQKVDVFSGTSSKRQFKTSNKVTIRGFSNQFKGNVARCHKSLPWDIVLNRLHTQKGFTPSWKNSRHQCI